MENIHIFLFLLLLGLVTGACSAEPAQVEVTRLVVETVEVTRIVEREIEVTRMITPTALPEGIFGSPECDAFIANIETLVSRWDDAYEVATSTPRMDLSDRIADMQAIKQDVAALTEPACAQPLDVRQRLINMMDDGVVIFTAFMGQDDTDFETSEYSVTLDLAADALRALRSEQKELPRRIHYWVDGTNSFSVDYMDENGEMKTADTDSTGRFDFDQMPVVFTAVIPEGGAGAAVRLYNPVSDNWEMTCFILVNGVEVVTETGTGEVMCASK